MAMDILVNTVSGNGLVPWGANVDLSSVRSRGIYLRTLSPEDLKIPISKARLKITFLKSHYDPPGKPNLAYVELRMTYKILHWIQVIDKCPSWYLPSLYFLAAVTDICFGTYMNAVDVIMHTL